MNSEKETFAAILRRNFFGTFGSYLSVPIIDPVNQRRGP